MTTGQNRPCGCGAEIGQRHQMWCSVARCRFNGHQLIACGDQWEENEDGELELIEEVGHDCEPDTWDGEYPGVKTCRELNLYTDLGSFWGVTEDLNQLYSRGKWNVEKERFELENRN